MKDLPGFAAFGFRAWELGQFSATVGFAPSEVRKRAALLVLDILASVIGALQGRMAPSALDASRALFPGRAGSVWFRGQRLSTVGATFANASAASALDMDDGHRGAAGHAGAAVVPAALAVAEATGARGDETLDAIALGYDVSLRIAASRRVEHLTHYNSGTWGAYGSAVAAGRLMGLDAREMTEAIAIAGAEAPVMLPTGMSRRMGSMVKEGLAWSAVSGLAAAERARAGGTGPEDLLDSAVIYDHAMMCGDLGRRWEVMSTYLKPYACCRYIHAPIDAIAALRVPGKPIRSLVVETFPAGLTLQNQIAPHSLEAAQYSYPFCCALAALRGIDALRPMNPDIIRDAEVLKLSAQVELRAAEDFENAFPARTPGRVTLDQGDGPRSMTVEYPRGDVANPMSVAQVADKFRVLAGGQITESRAEAVVAAALALEDRGLAPLCAVLAETIKI